MIFVGNTGIFVLGWCVPPSWTASSAQAWGHFCIFPRIIWNDPGQAYRIVTSAFTHQNIMHIGFNMLTFVASGPGIERDLGTIRFLNLIAALVLVLGAFFLCIADVALFFFRYGSYFNQCAAGFSGVLFALLTIEAYSLPADTQMNVFGNRVPARWYPWAQLLLCQLLIPNASMIGHLVGIIGGFCQHYGYMSWLIIPQSIAILVEESRLVSMIPSRASSSFVPCPAPDFPPMHSMPWGNSGARIWMSRLWPWRWMQSQNREQDVEEGIGHAEGRPTPSFTGFGTWGRGGTAYAPVQGMPPFSTPHAPPTSNAHTDTAAPAPSTVSASASQQVGDRANSSSGAHQSRLLDEMQAAQAQAGRQPRHPHLGVFEGAGNVHNHVQVTGGHRTVALGGGRSTLPTHVVGSPWRDEVNEGSKLPPRHSPQAGQAHAMMMQTGATATAPANAAATAAGAAVAATSVHPEALEWGSDRLPDVGFGSVLGAPPHPNHFQGTLGRGMDATLSEGVDMLAEMGCGSRVECEEALREAGGDVSAAAGHLVEMRESSLGPLRMMSQ